MGFTINVEIDEKALRQQVNADLAAKTKNAVNDQLRYLFLDGRGWNDNPGPAFKLIKEKVENILLSPDTEAKINKIIEENFDKVLEEATLTAMSHAARRLAFKNTDERIKAYKNVAS